MDEMILHEEPGSGSQFRLNLARESIAEGAVGVRFRILESPSREPHYEEVIPLGTCQGFASYKLSKFDGDGLSISYDASSDTYTIRFPWKTEPGAKRWSLLAEGERFTDMLKAVGCEVE